VATPRYEAPRSTGPRFEAPNPSRSTSSPPRPRRTRTVYVPTEVEVDDHPVVYVGERVTYFDMKHLVTLAVIAAFVIVVLALLVAGGHHG
jgi:hypothetical protein